jgi:hypothetical protein
MADIQLVFMMISLSMPMTDTRWPASGLDYPSFSPNLRTSVTRLSRTTIP